MLRGFFIWFMIIFMASSASACDGSHFLPESGAKNLFTDCSDNLIEQASNCLDEQSFLPASDESKTSREKSESSGCKDGLDHSDCLAGCCNLHMNSTKSLAVASECMSDRCWVSSPIHLSVFLEGPTKPPWS